MVDVTGKEVCLREAEAEGLIRLRRGTVERIKRGEVEKGDPLVVARIAGIQAAKLTPLLMPMCHPIEVTSVDVDCAVEGDDAVRCRARVRAVARTGVEMEALAAVTAALLNVWDMVKRYEKDEEGQYPTTRIEWIRVSWKRKQC